MLELAARDAVFHFNKKHLEDPTIPMWTLKCRGESYYVNHVTSTMPWSTKETPDNTHTKGSIKFKDVLLVIDDDNCAELRPLTKSDMARLRAKDKGHVRIMISSREKVQRFMDEHKIRYTPFKVINGGCGSSYYLCDIMDPNSIVMMRLGLGEGKFRIINENDPYYAAYDDPTLLASLDADAIEDFDGVEED